MGANQRARHARPDLERRRRAGDATENGPHERRVSLDIGPGMEVVADERELEACLLGLGGVAHEVCRSVLLAAECVSEACHRRRILAGPMPPRQNPSRRATRSYWRA